MDVKLYKEACDHADKEFAATHPNFHHWWCNHPDCDPVPRFAIPARVAFRVDHYWQEYLATK